MKIVYSSAEIMAAVQAVQSAQMQILSGIQQLQQKETDMANNLEVIQGKLNDLKDDVAEGKKVQDSAITLIQGIVAQNTAFAQQIKDLIAAGGTPEQLAAVVADFEATNAQMDTDRQALADAVAQNTPSA
jgi:cob(I)alamin adenosyltransferase